VRLPVRAAVVPYMGKFEGTCPHMYLDVYGKVTTAIGCLIDSIPSAVTVTWIHRLTNESASMSEVAAAWTTVKAAQGMAKLGGGAFAQLTDLRLTADGIATLVEQRLSQDEEYLRRRFHDYDDWPCDAQLGVLSNAWAAGAAWVAPHFDAAAKVHDWQACAGPEGDAGADPSCRGHAWLNDHLDVESDPLRNPGLRPRNLATKILFENAALGSEPSVLYWPEKLSSSLWPDYLSELSPAAVGSAGGILIG